MEKDPVWSRLPQEANGPGVIYRQLLPNTDNYCQIQTNIAKYRQLLSNTDKYCHILLLLFSRCQTCSGQKCLHLSIYVEKAKQKMLTENMRDRLKPPIWATLLTLSGRHDVLRDFNLVKKGVQKFLALVNPIPPPFGQCPNWKVFFVWMYLTVFLLDFF